MADVFTWCLFDSGASCVPDVFTWCLFDSEASCVTDVFTWCLFDSGASCVTDVFTWCLFDSGASCVPDVFTWCLFDSGASCVPDVFTWCLFDSGASCVTDVPLVGDGDAPYVDVLMTAMSDSDTYGFPYTATHLLDHLYLGAEEQARDLTLLRSLGITHVVNCASKYIDTGPDFYGQDFSYMGFHAEDDDSYDIMQHFQPVYDFIEKARLSGGKVLIHCVVGVNRSGVLAIAYCMLHKNMGPISAAKFVKESRKMMLTNNGFQVRLIAFAREKGMLHLDTDQLNKM